MATIDDWYALPFETRAATTYDDWRGATQNGAYVNTSPAPASSYPQDFPAAPTISTTPGGTGSESSGGLNINTPAPGNDANQIQGWASTYLGRNFTDADIAALKGQPLGLVQNGIANSPEAAAYALRQAGRPVPTTYAAPPPRSTNPTTTYSNDPHASLLINEVLSRLAQLRTPLDTSAQDAYIKQALSRVGQLDQAPFTDQQSAALLTQNMGPLTQARDSAKQQAAEQMSRRGITPSSGVFVDAMSKIDQAYERGVANVTNTLNVKGIDQATANQNAKLAIMNSIVDMTRATQMQQESLSAQLVPTASVLTNLDTSRLGSLLSASSSSDPSSLISSLVSLGSLGLNSQTQQNQQSAQSSAALAQLIYALMNGSAGLLN